MLLVLVGILVSSSSAIDGNQISTAFMLVDKDVEKQYCQLKTVYGFFGGIWPYDLVQRLCCSSGVFYLRFGYMTVVRGLVCSAVIFNFLDLALVMLIFSEVNSEHISFK